MDKANVFFDIVDIYYVLLNEYIMYARKLKNETSREAGNLELYR